MYRKRGKLLSFFKELSFLVGVVVIGHGLYLIYEPMSYVFIGIVLVYLSRPKR